MHVPRAPLLVPAVAALSAILAEQHGWAYSLAALVVLACMVTLCSDSAKAHRRITATVLIAFVAGAVVSALRGHPASLTAERPTARYAATVIADVRENDTGTSSTALAIDGVGIVRATVR